MLLYFAINLTIVLLTLIEERQEATEEEYKKELLSTFVIYGLFGAFIGAGMIACFAYLILAESVLYLKKRIKGL